MLQAVDLFMRRSARGFRIALRQEQAAVVGGERRASGGRQGGVKLISQRLRDEGAISDDVARTIQRDLDLMESHIHTGSTQNALMQHF